MLNAFDGVQLPPNAAAPIHCPPERSGALSVRENDDGRFAARSASELKPNRPRRFADNDCEKPSKRDWK